jgi:CubicO group peptidase (beta-lactamase class C family)
MPTLTRRTLALSAFAATIAAKAAAQAQAPTFADAAATDPAKLGWMQGSPPPADKRIAFEDGSYFQFPKTRWSFPNWRVFNRSVAVSRGDGPIAPLPRAPRPELDALTLTPLGATAPITWRQSLDATYADAIAVLHRGRLVYERYLGVTTPESQHILFSVTKSFVGTIAHALIAEGKLDPARTVASYIPELAQSGFGDAKVQHVLDMTTAVKFDENYSNPQSTIALYSAAGRLGPRPATYQGPNGLYDFAAAVPKDGVHGERFVYRTINTDVLAWIIARAENKPFVQILSERVWAPLGMEADAAIVTDSVGMPFAGGGLMARLRDVARFGEAMRRGGIAQGQRVFPAAAIAAITNGGDSARFTAAAWPTLTGWSYHGQWWISHNASGVFMARGINGQAIYIDPKAEMVIARFASHPIASNVANDPVSLPAYQAMAAALTGGPARKG